MSPFTHGLFALRYAPPAGPVLGPRWGSEPWRLVLPNGVTTEGVNYALEAGFRGGVRYATWYGGLIDDAGFTALSAADTHASHPGFGEFGGVAGGLRQPWAIGPAAGGVLASTSPCVFSVTANGAVRGALLASRQPTGLAAGAVLWATAAAPAGRAVAAGGTLTLTYTTRLTAR